LPIAPADHVAPLSGPRLRHGLRPGLLEPLDRSVVVADSNRLEELVFPAEVLDGGEDRLAVATFEHEVLDSQGDEVVV
jgi:hypothetical protein